VKAFCPHGALMGFDIGANPDAERYSFAFDARYVHNAPWPPMLCPNIDIRLRSYTNQLELGETNARAHDGQAGNF